MAETSKAFERRKSTGWFERHIKEPGIDIGSGIDPLNDTFRRWDQSRGDGDATLMNGVSDGTFNTVYASHVLEHLNDPLLAMRHWWRILAPGGNLIVLVPHRDLYEKQRLLPSRWNGDHKTYWLPDSFDPPVTWSFRWALEQSLPGAAFLSFEILDQGYAANGDGHPAGELSIEAVIRKPSETCGSTEYLPTECFQDDIRLRQWLGRTRATFPNWTASDIHLGQVTIDRKTGFETLLRHATSKDSPVIVETGTVRDASNWAGDGCSTLLFGLFVSRHGGQLHSIDTDQEALKVARSACGMFKNCEFHECDGAQWLGEFQGTIDVLYLDSKDTDSPGHAEHCLSEAKAAEAKIADDGLIAIDDTVFRSGRWLGKGSMAVPWLVGKGWRIIHSGYQVVLGRP